MKKLSAVVVTSAVVASGSLLGHDAAPGRAPAERLSPDRSMLEVEALRASGQLRAGPAVDVRRAATALLAWDERGFFPREA